MLYIDARLRRLMSIDAIHFFMAYLIVLNSYQLVQYLLPLITLICSVNGKTSGHSFHGNKPLLYIQGICKDVSMNLKFKFFLFLTVIQAW